MRKTTLQQSMAETMHINDSGIEETVSIIIAGACLLYDRFCVSAPSSSTAIVRNCFNRMRHHGTRRRCGIPRIFLE
jgi:hypothetical protein